MQVFLQLFYFLTKFADHVLYFYCAYVHLTHLRFFSQGTKAFCSGGDQALRGKNGYADFDDVGRLNVLDLQVATKLQFQ